MKIQTITVLAAFVALPALADTRMEYVDEKSGAQKSVISIKDGKVRMDNDDGSGFMLYEQATDTLTAVDTNEGTYTVMDEATMEKVSGEVNAAMAEMQKQLEQMPPEQREMMKKMMGGAAEMGKSMMEMEVEQTGKSMNKGGYDCRQVFVSVGSLSRQELCVVDAGEIDMTGSDRETLDAMQEQMRAIAEKMSQGLGVNLVMDFDSVGGMPVYMKEKRDRQGQVLKSVSHDVDAAQFEVPEGYREEKIDVGR